MRWLLTLFILVCPGGILIYLLGCWLLGQRPWDMWKEMTPDMYDGKEPYEQWVDKHFGLAHTHSWVNWSEKEGSFADMTRHRCDREFCTMAGIGRFEECAEPSHRHNGETNWVRRMHMARATQMKEENDERANV
jgi:hypothetical protein